MGAVVLGDNDNAVRSQAAPKVGRLIVLILGLPFASPPGADCPDETAKERKT